MQEVQLRKRALSVFVLLLGVYLATASFRVETIDTAVRLEVAKALVRQGTAAVPPLEMHTPFGVVGSFRGRDGRYYSVYGLGQSLLMVPFVLAAGGHELPAVTLINPIAVALTAALLVLIAGRLGFSARAGTALALLFGLCTLAWPHAKFTFEAPLEMLAATAALLGLLGGTRRGALLAGAAFGFALLLRPSAVTMAPALAWMLAGGERRGRRTAAFAAGAAPLAAIALFYNAYRWGSPFATGYVQTEFRYFALQWEGIVGLLASPGRGFFWYSPVLALGPFGFRAFRRRAPRAAGAVLLMAGAYLAFLSFVTVWNGDWTWGPRHLLPVVPLAALPLLPLLEPGGVRRAVLWPLVALSVAVQLVGVTLSYETYFVWHNQWMRDTGLRERAGAYHFHASRSQIYVETRQAVLFLSQLRERMAAYRPGTDAGPYSPLMERPPRITLHVPDLWWIYFRLIGAPPGATVALGLLCAGLIAAGAAGLRSSRR